jgi:surface antigen
MSKDFSVASLAALGSVLMALTLISGCASKNNSYYGSISTAGSYQETNSTLATFLNLAKNSAYSVPKQDRDQHESCVYFALENMNLGEQCDWYSKDGSTRGHVAVVSHRPQGSGWCTTLMNSVFHKGKWANWQDTACTSGAANQWRFVPR